MRQRRAITLIELLVVISASVIVLGMIAGLIGSLARAERSAEHHVVESERITQLCDSFRRAVWTATLAECVAGEQAVELSFENDRTIELRSIENQLIETERAGGQVIRQERYELSLYGDVRFTVRSENEHRWARMAIARQANQSSEHLHAIQVDARVGRDRRFRTKDE
jgi:hypothetical protein